MNTYNIFVALRCIPLGDASFSEASEHAKKINAYPLAKADDPPAGEYVDISGKHLPTLPVFLIFRLYGPEEAVFDKSFKLPDVEKTEW